MRQSWWTAMPESSSAMAVCWRGGICALVPVAELRQRAEYCHAYIRE